MADNLGSVRFQQRQLRLQRQQAKRQELLMLQHMDCEKHCLVQSCDLESACGFDDEQAAAQLLCATWMLGRWLPRLLVEKPHALPLGSP